MLKIKWFPYFPFFPIHFDHSHLNFCKYNQKTVHTEYIYWLNMLMYALFSGYIYKMQATVL